MWSREIEAPTGKDACLVLFATLTSDLFVNKRRAHVVMGFPCRVKKRIRLLIPKGFIRVDGEGGEGAGEFFVCSYVCGMRKGGGGKISPFPKDFPKPFPLKILMYFLPLTIPLSNYSLSPRFLSLSLSSYSLASFHHVCPDVKIQRKRLLGNDLGLRLSPPSPLGISLTDFYIHL